MNKAAQELGKLGGNATATKLGKEHFKNISVKGLKARWKKGASITGNRTIEFPNIKTPTPSFKMCKHGILLDIGVCKHGCK